MNVLGRDRCLQSVRGSCVLRCGVGSPCVFPLGHPDTGRHVYSKLPLRCLSFFSVPPLSSPQTLPGKLCVFPRLDTCLWKPCLTISTLTSAHQHSLQSLLGKAWGWRMPRPFLRAVTEGEGHLQLSLQSHPGPERGQQFQSHC